MYLSLLYLFSLSFSFSFLYSFSLVFLSNVPLISLSCCFSTIFCSCYCKWYSFVSFLSFVLALVSFVSVFLLFSCQMFPSFLCLVVVFLLYFVPVPITVNGIAVVSLVFGSLQFFACFLVKCYSHFSGFFLFFYYCQLCLFFVNLFFALVSFVSRFLYSFTLVSLNCSVMFCCFFMSYSPVYFMWYFFSVSLCCSVMFGPFFLSSPCFHVASCVCSSILFFVVLSCFVVFSSLIFLLFHVMFCFCFSIVLFIFL